MTKELLSSWGVKFEPIDVEANPKVFEELKQFGILRLPSVIMGDQSVQGWNPKQLAELVGVEYIESGRLPLTELRERLDKILAATQRAMEQVPDEHLGMVSPKRDRTVRDIGFHIFRLSLACRDAMEQRCFPEEWLLEKAPAEMAHGRAISQFGQMVRERLKEWFKLPGVYEDGVTTYCGYQTAHELLERTVWHAAQHLRQLYVFLTWMGEKPINPLTDAEFKGLPLPEKIW